MEKAYVYRIYPNKLQKELLAKTFGCNRFVYNYYLDKCINTYKEEGKLLTYYDCSNDLVNLKKDHEWLNEVDSVSLQSSLKHLHYAYSKFFKEKKGYPKFKSKKTHSYSYQTKYTNNNIQYLHKYLKLPKLGLVRTKNKLIPSGRILSATISQKPSGKYYVSITCADVEITALPKTNKSIGIDLGIKDFLVTSDSERIPNPKHLNKTLKKLAKLQRELSRKTKGGKNFEKARIKVARLQEKISNQRRDYLHKTSLKLIKENDIICMEDLSVASMIQNNKYAREISDVSMGEFARLLSYKAKWYDKIIIKVDKYYPSSKTCNVCGYKNDITNDLSIRSFVCPNCNTKLGRDINASINILKEGLRLIFLTN